MKEHLPQVLGSLVADTYAMLLPVLPGSNTADAAVEALVKRTLEQRSEKAFRLLLDELRTGEIIVTSDDLEPTLSMMLRYQRAALEGAALLNLRLLASVFAGTFQSRPLVADEFQSWADTLQGLKRIEIIAIANVHRYTTDRKGKPASSDFGRESEEFVKSLVPHPFRSEEELLAACTAASRTGLIMGQGDMNLFEYTSTPMMETLTKLVDFQEVLRKECP